MLDDALSAVESTFDRARPRHVQDDVRIEERKGKRPGLRGVARLTHAAVQIWDD